MGLIKGNKDFRELESHKLTEEVKGQSPLIKKGKVVYDASPRERKGINPPKAFHPNQEKTVQVFKEHRNPESPLSSTEDLAKTAEEAQKIGLKARSDADRVLAEAQNKAKKLIEQSKLYCETAYANAEREGFSSGETEGRKAGWEELKSLIHSLQNGYQQLLEQKDLLAKRGEQGLAKLAITIAERIIASEVTTNPNVIVNMVRANLERVKEREQVIIRVHPDDQGIAEKNRSSFAQLVPGVRALEIQADPRVERGGCMIETNLGIVDASISTQLEAISLAFAQADAQEAQEEQAALEASEEPPPDA